MTNRELETLTTVAFAFPIVVLVLVVDLARGYPSLLCWWVGFSLAWIIGTGCDLGYEDRYADFCEEVSIPFWEGRNEEHAARLRRQVARCRVFSVVGDVVCFPLAPWRLLRRTLTRK